jgi:hypothetical protein
VKNGYARRYFYLTSAREIEDEAADEEARKVRPGFQVKIDRPNNKLVVTSHRIVGIKVKLNDVILDLEKDVTVEVNGKTLYNGRPKRGLKKLYDSFLDSGDWTRLYTWEVDIKIPQPEKKEGEEEGAKKSDEEKPGEKKPDEKKATAKEPAGK